MSFVDVLPAYGIVIGCIQFGHGLECMKLCKTLSEIWFSFDKTVCHRLCRYHWKDLNCLVTI